VVVLLHGGFWRARYDRSSTVALAKDVVRRGWAAWNVEYRRVGQPGGGWPGTLDDVAAAVDHLAPLADDEPLDLTRVAAVGHSAGGHLAAWTAARAALPAGAPGADPAVRPVAAVCLAGVLDLRGAADEHLGDGAAVGFLGAHPEDAPERYGLASPIDRLPSGVPTRCVHGRLDDVVPPDQSARFVAAATAAGDDASLAPFDGDHFDVLDPGHESWTGAAAWLATHLDR
jgi:acetyl esterase/lipase